MLASFDLRDRLTVSVRLSNLVDIRGVAEGVHGAARQVLGRIVQHLGHPADNSTQL
jgi:hypothetical protein